MKRAADRTVAKVLEQCRRIVALIADLDAPLEPDTLLATLAELLALGLAVPYVDAHTSDVAVPDLSDEHYDRVERLEGRFEEKVRRLVTRPVKPTTPHLDEIDIAVHAVMEMLALADEIERELTEHDPADAQWICYLGFHDDRVIAFIRAVATFVHYLSPFDPQDPDETPDLAQALDRPRELPVPDADADLDKSLEQVRGLVEDLHEWFNRS